MSRPLRFCMITTFYPPFSFGGDATYTLQLASELAERGHYVEVIHCIDSYNLLARGETPRSYKAHPNVVVHRLQSGLGGLSPLATQQTGYPLFKTGKIRAVLDRGFDVIHYHNISLVGGPELLKLGSAVKLYTTHEYWLVCPMSVLFRYDGGACEEKQCLRCTLAYGRPPQWWRYTKMLDDALKHVDMLLHPSPFSMRKHRELGIRTPATVMPYFDTPADLPTVVPPAPMAKPYFLFVGRFEKIKGAQTLIPLFRDYDKAHLTLVGEGSQRAELERLAGKSPNIEFLKWMNKSELAGLYRDATALIVPSLCYENAPLVVLEAHRQKTPVIGRHLGSLPDLLTEQGGGMTYTDEASLRAILDDLLAHPDKRNTLGQNGFEAYKRQFTAQAHLDRYFEIIQEARCRRRNP
ncbi:MAG: glycosyltransferase family 4 protein [Anaerolineae bacterium]|nr:glycosyltransferase family 4 protein [Anaerolineae bacterium]